MLMKSINEHQIVKSTTCKLVHKITDIQHNGSANLTSVVSLCMLLVFAQALTSNLSYLEAYPSQLWLIS